MSDERSTEAEGGPRRIPIYDRRRVRPDDMTGDAMGSEPTAGYGATETQGDRPPGPGPDATAAAGATEPSTGAPVAPGTAGADAATPAEGAEPGPGDADELQLAQATAAEHLADLQRLQAEFANYRKRVLREQTELVDRAAGHLVNRLLSVLDSFELAVSAAEETKDFERMLRGVEMVLGELKGVLAAEGLEPIPAKNHPFDPNLHEAALEVPGDEDGEPVVAEVLRPGYVLKGRILRPAMVKVTRRKLDGEKGEPAGT